MARSRPPRLCLGRPGRPCSTLVDPADGSRCSGCQSERERARGTRQERGYDAVWQRLRKVAIRMQPWCSACGATEDLTGEHRVPLSKGGRNVLSNVDVLCRSCNSSRGNRG